MIEAKAAITDGEGNYILDTITVNDPGPDEVLVRIMASGICHTDWNSRNWGRHMVMGHEGAGIVKAVGQQVTHVQPGDHVAMNWAINCGECFQCLHGNTNICERPKDPHPESTVYQGKPLARSFAIGTMSTHAVVRKEAVLAIDKDIPFSSASIVGCGVMTGYGSAVNAARVKPGSSVAVIGCGGVGLNTIQGARVAGASTIIAIDRKPSRLEMARQFGATHTIQPPDDDPEFDAVLEQVKALCDGRGADYAFEATGVPILGFMPLKLVRNAGTAVQISGVEQDLTVDMEWFKWDKLYTNVLYGKCNPAIDFPQLFSLYRKGDLLLDELVTRTYTLDQLADGFADMLAGRNAKGVILMES